MSATRCPGGARHWFAYRGTVGTSAPVCRRFGCGAPNPNYRPDDDPYFEEVPAATVDLAQALIDSLRRTHPVDPDCTCPSCDGPGGA